MAKSSSIEIGQVFGRLTVIASKGKDKRGPLWLCRCECGGEKIVTAYSLTSGSTKSCGCLARERMKKMQQQRCGQKVTTNRHQMSLCWNCIRSAAPMSIQCVRDKSKGREVPEGAVLDAGGRIVIACPEFLSIHDSQNMQRLLQERKRVHAEIIRETEESGLTTGMAGRNMSATSKWWKAR